MTRLLLELTAAPSCWQQNVLASVKVAVNEIERLRILEDRKCALHKQEPTAAQLQAFEVWLQDHVTQDYQQASRDLVVSVAHVGDTEGNGLIAKKDIKKGEPFLAIPYSTILGSHLEVGPPIASSATRAAWQQVADDPLLKHFPSCMLALRLLGEACLGDESFFHPYISILPTKFAVPLFYNVADFKYLEGTSLFEPAVKLLYNSIKQYCYFHTLLARMKHKSPIPLDKFTVGNYFWALGVVLTRQNEVVLREGAETAMALIPGWDLCNHEHSDMICTFSDPQARVITCHAIREFKSNEQVKMFYGKRSNEHLLLYSGFVEDENDYDNVQLELQLVDSDPLVKIKRMLIAKEADYVPMKDQGKLVYYRIDLSGGIVTPAMTRAVQIASMNKPNLTAALRNPDVVGTKTLYHWDDDENQASLNQHRARCQIARANIVKHIQVDPENAKHGTLFQRYFKHQLEVLDAAIANLNRVQC
uniref:protein-histidine N-methyltransferase n=1 Tax=Globisporangium ultimum (strain ATCC 200006 / CBS 805.95 / DAOM BR144) TaxID=431595 RepID=K3WHK2_GLOUD